MKFGLVALATLAFATSASAATNTNPFAEDQVILNLKGLDLATADGQQRLAIRVNQAARAVCGGDMSSIHLAVEAQARDCRVAVVADVRSQIEARLASADGVSQIRIARLR